MNDEPPFNHTTGHIDRPPSAGPGYPAMTLDGQTDSAQSPSLAQRFLSLFRPSSASKRSLDGTTTQDRSLPGQGTEAFVLSQPIDWSRSTHDLSYNADPFQPAAPTRCQPCGAIWADTVSANESALRGWATNLQYGHDREVAGLQQQHGNDTAALRTQVDQLAAQISALRAENARLSAAHNPDLLQQLTASQQDNRLLKCRVEELGSENETLSHIASECQRTSDRLTRIMQNVAYHLIPAVQREVNGVFDKSLREVKAALSGSVEPGASTSLTPFPIPGRSSSIPHWGDITNSNGLSSNIGMSARSGPVPDMPNALFPGSPQNLAQRQPVLMTSQGAETMSRAASLASTSRPVSPALSIASGACHTPPTTAQAAGHLVTL